MELAERLKNGDRIACARAISVVENGTEGSEELLEAVFPAWGRAARIGITGAPGSGKSSLVNYLASRIREDGRTIGIIAIDPTSPFSGGALLGDRIRMSRVQLDSGVFIRSLATRGSLGGLTKAADDVAMIFDAFGRDYVIFETVGVGQSEVDIAHSAETTVLVLTPEAGDAVQTLKAGIMEIADVFVVNKSDRPGADRVVADIRMMLDMERHKYDAGSWRPPIVCTVATTGEGIEELYTEILAHRRHLESAGLLEKKREHAARRKLRMVIETLLAERVFEGESGALVDKKTREVAAGKCTPLAAAREIVSQCLKGGASG
jgi:LAO/AO transport system kinase